MTVAALRAMLADTASDRSALRATGRALSGSPEKAACMGGLFGGIRPKHDPEKACPARDAGCNRFSEKDMLQHLIVFGPVAVEAQQVRTIYATMR